MYFWEIFKNNKDSNNKGRLQEKLEEILPNMDEDQLIKVTCIAGLLARIAYANMEIDPKEKEHMKIALNEWTNLEDNIIEVIVNIAVEEVVDLAGTENHKYTRPLQNLMNSSERYQLLETLFAIAASDGEVINMESEEIRIISKGLNLSQIDFISARASVLNKLKIINEKKG